MSQPSAAKSTHDSSLQYRGHTNCQTPRSSTNTIWPVDKSKARQQLQSLQEDLRHVSISGDVATPTFVDTVQRAGAGAREPNMLLQKLDEICMHHTMTIQLTHAKPVDHLTALPLEVLQLIINYIEYKQLLRCLLVCKTWRRQLISLPPLSNTVDFRDARVKVNCMTLNAVVRRQSRVPERVMVSRLTRHAAKLMRHHIASWLRSGFMNHLELNSSWSLIERSQLDFGGLQSITFGSQARIVISDLHSVLKRCPNLKSGIFKCVTEKPSEGFIFDWELESQHSHLEVLEVTCKNGDYLMFSTRSLHCFPNLTRLVCRGVGIRGLDGDMSSLDLSKFKRLREVDLLGSTVALEAEFPNVLVSYAVAQLTIWMTRPTSALYSQLKVLHFGKSEDGTVLGLGQNVIANGQSRIEDVSLHIHTRLMPDVIEFLATAQGRHLFSNVRRLYLEFECLHGGNSPYFVQCMPKLEKLVLEDRAWSYSDDDWHSRTGFLCCLLFEPSCRLQHIILRARCKGRDRRDLLDVVKWVRDRGFVADLEELDRGSWFKLC